MIELSKYSNKDINVPKYKLVINSILKAIEEGDLKKGDKVPSINKICADFSLSRDTVLLSFKELKAKGIISSIPGKGYYIEKVSTSHKHNVFLLFDEFNIFKEDLYNSFIENLKGKANVDLYFHHFNINVFKSLINENSGRYTTYVIMPATFNDISQTLDTIPGDNVYMLDRLKTKLSGYPAIYQDFNNGLFYALSNNPMLLKKYEKMIMVYPGGKEPIGRKYGFVRFCKEAGLSHEIIASTKDLNVQKGEVYFVTSDRDLVRIVKQVEEKKLQLGKDIGLVSFNDTILKEVVAGGITTITTDFNEMGRLLADSVLNRKRETIECDTYMVKRSSL